MSKLLAAPQQEKLAFAAPSKIEQDAGTVKDWHPWPYQRTAVQFLLKQCAAGLFLHPGLGKTSIALKALDVLRENQLAAPALVAAPLRPAYEVWPHQIEQWRQFAHLRYTILHGDDKDYAVRTPADVYVINYDGLPWLFRRQAGLQNGNGRAHGCSPFEFIKPQVLVLDESSKVKRTSTMRFKLLKPYLSYFKRRWILTGSPNPNGYLDLFGQIYCLDLGAALGQFVSHYRSNYFLPTGGQGHIVYNWRLAAGGEKAIQRRIKPLVLSLSEQDYLKVPQEVPNVIRVTLPAEARRVYDDLEDEMFATLEDKTIVTAVNAAVASMKCCQVASGGIYQAQARNGKLERATKQLHSAKTDALVDLLEELQGTPLLLGFEFNHDLERILQVLPRSTPYIKGGVRPQEVNRIIQLWNTNKLPVLPCNVESVAHGLNLQEGGCQHVAFYTVPWNYESYDQFIRRVRRQGNRHGHVIVHHFIARDTVDETKLRAMRSKERTQRGLMQALQAYARQRKRSRT